VSEKESQQMDLVVSQCSEAKTKWRGALRSIRKAQQHHGQLSRLKKRLDFEEKTKSFAGGKKETWKGKPSVARRACKTPRDALPREIFSFVKLWHRFLRPQFVNVTWFFVALFNRAAGATLESVSKVPSWT
jgi:hypothetical protein